MTDKLRKPGVAAAAGATGALVMAMFTPAAVLLGLGAAAAAGVYYYNRKSRKKDEKGETIDVEPINETEAK